MAPSPSRARLRKPFGKATDDKSMQLDGKKDQASADVKNTAADTRDSEGKAVEVEEKLRRQVGPSSSTRRTK